MALRDRLISRLGYQVEPMFVPDTENRAVVGVTVTASLTGAVFATPRFSVSGTNIGSTW